MATCCGVMRPEVIDFSASTAETETMTVAEPVTPAGSVARHLMVAMPGAAELKVAGHALERGYLSRESLRQALLLREELRARGEPVGLLPLLLRSLSQDHLEELREVWRREMAANCWRCTCASSGSTASSRRVNR